MRIRLLIALGVSLLIGGSALAWEQLWPPDCTNNACVALPVIRNAGAAVVPSPSPTAFLPAWYPHPSLCDPGAPQPAEGLQAWTITQVFTSTGSPDQYTYYLCSRLFVDGRLAANAPIQIVMHFPDHDFIESMDPQRNSMPLSRTQLDGVWLNPDIRPEDAGRTIPMKVARFYLNRMYLTETSLTIHP